MRNTDDAAVRREFEHSRENVARVLEICARRGRIAVLMQDNPDPDALACAAAFHDLIGQKLGKRVVIGYGGICGRAENRAMMRELHIDARRMTPAQVDAFATLCLVDAQPQSGNNDLLGTRRASIVIDHHLLPARGVNAEFHDIRPCYGAASTILYEYMRAAKVRISAQLATALFYGIQSDTQDLGRELSPNGIRAYQELFLLADPRKLTHIRRAPVPREYFQMLADSLADCVVAGTTVISCIRRCSNADMIPEVADLLMRLEGMRCAVCFGVYDGEIRLSARAVDGRGNMALRIKQVVARIGEGGGHRAMAGGRIPIRKDEATALQQVRDRIHTVFARGRKPMPLMSA